MEDLTGKTYGKLTVLERVDDQVSPKGVHTARWRCVCECGNETVVRGDKLRSGNTTSCGCFRRDVSGARNRIDIAPGTRFGKLTVLHRVQGSDWLCKCDCGNECIRKTGALRSGNTTGCGQCRAENLTGRCFGDFKVLERAIDERNKDSIWLCECMKCGSRRTFSKTVLKSDPSCQSCKISYDDLTGQTFGHLQVIKRIEDYVSPSGSKKINWLCKCQCGNYTTATSQLLKKGEKLSCGCLRKDKLSDIRTLNLEGKRFGRLTVERRADSDYFTPGGGRSVKWHCVCDCGNSIDVIGSRLVSGATQSCGCLQKERAGAYAFRDLTGQQIGSWTVLQQSGHTDYGSILWRCRCENCGREYDVSSGNLRSGASQMCTECAAKKNGESRRLDLVGQTFGRLTVIDFAGVLNNQSMWRVRCECGNEKIAHGSSLTSGNTQSCGCWHRSKYEDWTEQYLCEHNIEYATQVKFSDLTGVGGSPLSYDFAVLDNGTPKILIECQGQQHYQSIEMFGGDKQLEKQKEHDKKKAEFAASLLIPLIEMPYYEAESYEMVSSFLNKKLGDI